MQVGELCVRLSSIRRLTRRGRGALGARYRLCRKISSALRATVAGRRWHAPNTSPRGAAPSRSRLTLIKPWYSPTWGWSALQGVPNAGALLSGPRSEPAHASRSPARLIARFARNRADSRRGAHTRSERPAQRIGAQIGRRRPAGAGLALTIQIVAKRKLAPEPTERWIVAKGIVREDAAAMAKALVPRYAVSAKQGPGLSSLLSAGGREEALLPCRREKPGASRRPSRPCARPHLAPVGGFKPQVNPPRTRGTDLDLLARHRGVHWRRKRAKPNEAGGRSSPSSVDGSGRLRCRLQRLGFRLQERVGDPVAESQEAGCGQR